MTLHILSQNNPQILANCLCTSVSGDVIILINDGVYNLATQPNFGDHLKVYALDEDTKTRGLSFKNTLSYKEFVALSCQHTPIQTWY